MAIELLTPVGRMVQGGITLEKQTDDNGNPKLDSSGQQVLQCFIALAIRKDEPAFPAFYAAMVNVARTEFPHLLGADGSITHPQFAWKLQDGDGVDSAGKSVAEKPGFAGHYVLKLATQFLPKCYYAGKYDPAQQIQNPTEIFKRGYFIRVNVRITGNGVKPDDRSRKPGLFLSPNLVEFVGFGPEISSGPDASKVFGTAPAPQLPPGASATPVGGIPAPIGMPAPGGMPQMPQMPQMPAPGGMPQMPQMPQMPAPGGMPQMPAPIGMPQAQTYTMTALALGATRESLLAGGWNDQALVEQGLMFRSA